MATYFSCHNKIRFTIAACVTLISIAASQPATATPVSFSATGTGVIAGTPLAYSATFEVVAGDLVVVLTNDTPDSNNIRRGDLLTGVVFSFAGTDPVLSLTSTILNPGSILYSNGTPTVASSQVITDSYRFKKPGDPGAFTIGGVGFEYGLSTIGGGVFASPSLGSGGEDYAIAGSTGVLNNSSFSSSVFPLVVDSIKFTLDGFDGLSPEQIYDVAFLCGSLPDQTIRSNEVPEPGTSALMLLGGLTTLLAGRHGVSRRR